MTLATCAKDVKFYQWSDLSYLGAFESSLDSIGVKCASWCCDGRELLVVKSKGDPVIVGAPTRTNREIEVCSFVPLSHASVGAFSNTNPGKLAFGCETGEIHIYDLHEKTTTKFKKLPCGVQNMDFSVGDHCVVAGTFDGQIYLYDAKTRPSASFFIPNCRTLSTTVFSRYNHNLLAGASKEGSLCVWDIQSTDSILYSRSHSSRITDVAFLENCVSTVGTDGYYCVFDLRQQNLASRYNLDGALSSIAYVPDNYDVAISTYNQLRCYDTRNMKSPKRTFLIYNSANIKKIAFAPVGHNTKDFDRSRTFMPRERSKNLDTISASGDFSVSSGSTTELMQKKEETKEERQSKNVALQSSSVSFQIPSRLQNSKNYEVVKALEETVKASCAKFSERLSQTFFGMRIGSSKKFITTENKIADAWYNFTNYLKYSGAASGSSQKLRGATPQNESEEEIRGHSSTVKSEIPNYSNEEEDEKIEE